MIIEKYSRGPQPPWQTVVKWKNGPCAYEFTVSHARRLAKNVRHLRHLTEKEFGCKVSFKIKKHHSKL